MLIGEEERRVRRDIERGRLGKMTRNDLELGLGLKRRPEDVTTGPTRVVCNALKPDLAVLSPKASNIV
ncbi:hypothetical protein BBP40_010130 [Aspergillus hancockii]|nr:hypothetical protein BBP40_010130 [Aspergillus hancockii]